MDESCISSPRSEISHYWTLVPRPGQPEEKPTDSIDGARVRQSNLIFRTSDLRWDSSNFKISSRGVHDDSDLVALIYEGNFVRLIVKLIHCQSWQPFDPRARSDIQFGS